MTGAMLGSLSKSYEDMYMCIRNLPLSQVSKHIQYLYLRITCSGFGDIYSQKPAVWGTSAIPFLASSALGFALGASRWYYASLETALLHLDAYPELLRLHLHTNYPRERFGRMGAEAFRSERFQRDWKLKSMLVSSWLTAQPAIDVCHYPPMAS